jgi:predicted GH43/DUF377 family glycosyl hydrolase
VYHGVRELSLATGGASNTCYSAGVMLLSKEHPNRIIYRSPEPVLEPEGPLECHGIVNNVVFPTGIDCRIDLSSPDRFDIYYGMADDRIGVARLDLPGTLPGRVKEGNQAEV